jgi:hypothetical protein
LCIDAFELEIEEKFAFVDMTEISGRIVLSKTQRNAWMKEYKAAVADIQSSKQSVLKLKSLMNKKMIENLVGFEVATRGREGRDEVLSFAICVNANGVAFNVRGKVGSTSKREVIHFVSINLTKWPKQDATSIPLNSLQTRCCNCEFGEDKDGKCKHTASPRKVLQN